MKKIVLSLLLVCSVQLSAKGEQNEKKEKLVTPTLWTVAPDMFACNLTNIDEKVHPVLVRIVSNGKVVLERKIEALEPRHTSNTKVAGLPKGAPFYCEFTVEGDEDNYRGVAVLYHAPLGSDFVARPAT